MDFRQQKLWLALKIMGTGMILALIWHGIQGWVLGRSYPYNTFLYIPSERFSDFTYPVVYTTLPTPYLSRYADYFPLTYLILRFFIHLNARMVVLGFVLSFSFGIFLVLSKALRPVIDNGPKRLAAAAALMAFSYPFLFCLDRGNLEIILVLFVSLALLLFKDRRWHTGMASLLPAVCIKFYPILLMTLFIRPRHLLKLVGMVVAFFGIGILCVMTFTGTLLDNWQLWQNNLAFYHSAYVVGNGGLAGSASIWNTLKILVFTYLSFVPTEITIADLPGLIEQLYRTYVVLDLAWIGFIVAYTLLVEREFYRRAILFLLIASMAAPSGGDYKLLFAQIALVVFILLPTRRPRDLTILCCLAFVMVPKREVLLTYLGRTDSGAADISVAVLINPLLMVVAMVLLMMDGFQPGVWRHIGLRFRRLFHIFIRFLPHSQGKKAAETSPGSIALPR